MLKRDDIAFGVLIGLVLPILFYGLLSFVALLVQPGTAWTLPFESNRRMMLALIINVIPLRVYFVKYKFDKTGRGILLITFLLMVFYFLIIRYF
jgi:hypothetical protein